MEWAPSHMNKEGIIQQFHTENAGILLQPIKANMQQNMSPAQKKLKNILVKLFLKNHLTA